MIYFSLCIVSLLIPYPTIQHFIWPLHWCLLADLCNHTWIPECGTENDEDVYSRRLFIDECDMYEYNCDFAKDYYPINYSDCFNLPTTRCPPMRPCPTCKAGLRIGHGHSPVPQRRLAVKPTTLGVSLPERMLKGKRRYTPIWRKKTRRTTRPITRKVTRNVTRKVTRKITRKTSVTLPVTTKKTVRTMVINQQSKSMIIKTQKVMKNGKIMIKVVKGFMVKRIGQKTTDRSDDFLE